MDAPVPVVSDAELDRLGRQFLAHGGHTRLGPFEAFVRRAAHQQRVDLRAYACAIRRREIDHLMRQP